MSFPVLEVTDPRLPQREQYKVTQKNPLFTGWYRSPAIDQTNTSTSVYNVVLPDRRNHGLSRRMYVHTVGTITITGNLGTQDQANYAPGPPIVPGTRTLNPTWDFCLKQNMLSSITTSTIVDLNDLGVSLAQTNTNIYSNAMQYYRGGETLAASYRSGSNAKRNRFTQFLNTTGDPAGNFAGYTTVQTSKDIAPPSSAYSQLPYYTLSAAAIGASGTITGLVIPFELYEPLQCSLFEPSDDKEHEYFYGCSRLSITRTLNCTASNCIKANLLAGGDDIALAAAFAGLTFQITFSTNELMYNVIDVPTESIPRLLSYKVVQYQRYPAIVPGIANIPVVQGTFAGISACPEYTMASQAIPLASMPSAIMLLCTVTQNQNNACLRPDLYMPFTTFSVQIETQSGVFQNCVGINAYDMCLKNGLCTDFLQFSGAFVSGNLGSMKLSIPGSAAVGNGTKLYGNQQMSLNSVPILIRAEDLPAFSKVGESHMFSLTVTPKINFNAMSVAVDNISSMGYSVGAANLSFEFDVIVIYESLLTVDKEGTARLDQIYINPQDLKDAIETRRQGSKRTIGNGFLEDASSSLANALGAAIDISQGKIGNVIDRIQGNRKGLFGSGKPDVQATAGPRLTKSELLASLSK